MAPKVTAPVTQRKDGRACGGRGLQDLADCTQGEAQRRLVEDERRQGCEQDSAPVNQPVLLEQHGADHGNGTEKWDFERRQRLDRPVAHPGQKGTVDETG